MFTSRSTRTRSLTAIAAALVIALAAGTADARAGKSSSSGSRGTRTYDAPATTNTAPSTAAPMQRSATPDAPSAGMQRPGMATPAAQPGGFFSRGGFMGALAGGLLGAGLFGLLSGSGLFGGMAGFASVIGLLLQLALIGGLIWLAVRFFRSRSAQQPAYAAGAMGAGPMGNGQAGYQRQGHPGVMGGGTGSGLGGLAGGLGGGLGGGMGQRPAPRARGERSDEIGIGPSDYQEFEGLLVGIQDAYGREDSFALRQMATPEMAKYFTDDLAENASRGLHNRVSDAQLLQGDLAEAWREPGAEYATVAMRFGLIDVTVERATGRVVEGDPNTRTEATELWTFRRAPGGRWQLSAIQQTN